MAFTSLCCSFHTLSLLYRLSSLQISLILDILMCLCSDLTEAEFVNGARAGCSSPVGPRGEAVKSARSVLWRTLRGVPLCLGTWLTRLSFPFCRFLLLWWVQWHCICSTRCRWTLRLPDNVGQGTYRPSDWGRIRDAGSLSRSGEPQWKVSWTSG